MAGNGSGSSGDTLQRTPDAKRPRSRADYFKSSQSVNRQYQSNIGSPIKKFGADIFDKELNLNALTTSQDDIKYRKDYPELPKKRDRNFWSPAMILNTNRSFQNLSSFKRMREIQCELPQKRARHMPNLFQRQQTGHFGASAPYYGKDE